MTTPSIETIPYGYCHCGCGQKTSIASRNDLRKPHQVKGEPVWFIHNHHLTSPRIDTDELGHFKLDGHYCRLIALTKGMYAIVWEEDYEKLAAHNWQATWDRKNDTHYATRSEVVNGRHYSIKMHREILGLTRGDKREGDHIRAGDTLDNRRDRLRICGNEQNQQNKRRQRSSSTGFKGVYKRGNSYTAHIRVRGVLKHLGTRKTPEAAHELYNVAAMRCFGEFANDGENGLYDPTGLADA